MLKDSPAFSGFAVNDLDAAKAFYGGKLGLDARPGPMGGLELTWGILRGNGPDIAWFKDPSGNILSVLKVDAR